MLSASADNPARSGTVRFSNAPRHAIDFLREAPTILSHSAILAPTEGSTVPCKEPAHRLDPCLAK